MARGMIRPWRGTGIRPLDDLYKEMDGLVQQFLGDEASAVATKDFVPRLNVSESDSGYDVSIDLPGMKPEDVSVEVHDNVLTVSGKRESEHEEEDKTFHRVERHFGEFRRAITLPTAVDEDAIAADYVDGVLKVSLPKSEKQKPRRIQVRSNGQ